LFIIEVFVAFEGVCEMFIGFLMGVNSTHGSWNDYGELVGLDYGSFGLPSFTEKGDDQMSNSFVIFNIIFIFLFWICLWDL
jgi:hypothetical protein